MKTAKRLSTTNRQQVEQITDLELIKALERREHLEAAAKEFKVLDEKVKTILKGLNKPTIFAGPFTVQVLDKTMTQYKVPQDVKDEYKEIKDYQTVTITRTDS